MSSYDSENTSSCIRQKQWAYRTSKKSDNTAQTCVATGRVQGLKGSGFEVIFPHVSTQMGAHVLSETCPRSWDGFKTPEYHQQKSTRVWRTERELLSLASVSPGMKTPQWKKVEKYGKDNFSRTHAYTHVIDTIKRARHIKFACLTEMDLSSSEIFEIPVLLS